MTIRTEAAVRSRSQRSLAAGGGDDAKKFEKTDKSVHRMTGPRGNPRAGNILEIVKILQTNERVKLRVEARKAAAQGMSSRKTRVCRPVSMFACRLVSPWPAGVTSRGD